MEAPALEEDRVMVDESRLRGYTIEGGRTDADRLARQARVMAGATAAFLSRIGLEAGWSCLDVGCGDGQVTLELARAAGPSPSRFIKLWGTSVERGSIELRQRLTVPV